MVRDAWRYGSAVLVVGGTFAMADLLNRHFHVTRLSSVFLASVLLLAVWHGTSVAFFAAVLAFAAYNFYLVEPRFTLQLVSAEDFITLAVFLAVALLTGGLAGRVRDEAQRSRLRAHTTAALFQASREMSATADEDRLRGSLAVRIAEAAQGEACILYRGRVWSAPAESELTPAEMERLAAPLPEGSEALVAPWRDGWRTRALRVDGESLGIALWRTVPAASALGGDDTLIPVLADLGAAAIARARLSAEKSEVEALARTERLRAALLSSISHDFRTPLASILASVSSLREYGDHFPKETRDDLLSTIQEETERLNRFVVNLLNMTKLEAGAVEVRPGVVDIAEIVHAVIGRRQSTAGGRPLVSTLPDASMVATGDPVLFEQALANVVDNAIRFSPPRSAVTLGAWSSDGRATLDVEDHGPGVVPSEAEKIFEKFYRCPTTATAQPGTGLGLSITRGLVDSMGGAVEAGPRRDGQPGLRVSLSLPFWTG